MSTFAERFKELRLQKNMTQKELADYFNKSDALFSKYEKGKSVPEYNFLLELADYFNVSLDYLVGRSESSFESPVTKSTKGEKDLSKLLDSLAVITNDQQDFLSIELKNNKKFKLSKDKLKSMFKYFDTLGINIEELINIDIEEKLKNINMFNESLYQVNSITDNLRKYLKIKK